jgi:hypothetical protein
MELAQNMTLSMSDTIFLTDRVYARTAAQAQAGTITFAARAVHMREEDRWDG